MITGNNLMRKIRQLKNKKQVGLYEIESIDNIIAISVNPKKYFESKETRQ